MTNNIKKILLFQTALFILISCSESPTGSAAYEELVSVYDYSYQYNRFFFFDNYYRDRFEEGYSEDLKFFIYEAGMEIFELQVWIADNSARDDVVPGAAVLDPTDPQWQDYQEEYHMIQDKTGQAESGTFRQLDDSFYSYDPYRGFFWLSASANSRQTIAIIYQLANGQQVGHFSDSTYNVLLKLIKPKYQVPTQQYASTWSLLMQNVYYFGDSLSAQTDYNIEIRETISESKKDSSGTSYLYLTGLDILDEYFIPVENGDGKMDINTFLFDFRKGLLIFPGLQPFDPLPQSRFQIRDEDRADIYNIIDTIDKIVAGKYKISLLARD